MPYIKDEQSGLFIPTKMQHLDMFHFEKHSTGITTIKFCRWTWEGEKKETKIFSSHHGDDKESIFSKEVDIENFHLPMSFPHSTTQNLVAGFITSILGFKEFEVLPQKPELDIMRCNNEDCKCYILLFDQQG